MDPTPLEFWICLSDGSAGELPLLSPPPYVAHFRVEACLRYLHDAAEAREDAVAHVRVCESSRRARP